MKQIFLAVGALVIMGGAVATYVLTQESSPIFGKKMDAALTAQQPIQMTTYRTPSCGCCGYWVEHAQTSGFIVEDVKQDDLTAIKEQFGITPELASCHTTVANGYVFEGHIPAGDIQRFLADPPADAVGLAVPGMPLGSPGMEAGDRHQAYEVLALHKDGTIKVFQEYMD